MVVGSTLSLIKPYIFFIKATSLTFHQWLGDVWHLTSKINKLEVKLTMALRYPYRYVNQVLTHSSMMSEIGELTSERGLSQ